MDEIIRVEALQVAYAGVRAVDGIDFTVRRGEVFALLGTNGAGKTTTLDVLEGYRPPTAGQVRVLGEDPWRHRDRLAPRVGIMLQDAGFFETLTVAQTVNAWRRFHTDPIPAEAAIATVGLTGRRRVRCSQLSGGERRRLDLCLALLGSPELIFLDEPTSGMDPEARQQSMGLIRALVTDGVTVVLTTHYLDEAEQLADRVAIMDAGRIRAYGTLTEMRRMAGRSSITFGLDPAWVDDLPTTETVSIRRRAEIADVTVTAADAQAVVRDLTDWASRVGVELRDLRVVPGGLEQLFHQIAGAARHSEREERRRAGRKAS